MKIDEAGKNRCENFIATLKQFESKFAWVHSNGELVSQLFDSEKEALLEVSFDLTKEERKKLQEQLNR
jgi:hypothetical protein